MAKLEKWQLIYLEPLVCYDCGKHMGFINPYDNQSLFYCDECVARLRASLSPDEIKRDWLAGELTRLNGPAPPIEAYAKPELGDVGVGKDNRYHIWVGDAWHPPVQP